MPWTSIEATIAACSLAIVLFLRRALTRTLSNIPLHGPPSKSLVTGALMDVFLHDDPPSVYVTWAQQYGHAFKLPRGMGANSTVLCDPKAAQHVLTRDTSIYVHTPFRSAFLMQLVGSGLVSSEGESHRRQRKYLSPAFANTEIRKLTAIFYESAYKVKEHWETLIAQNDGIQTVVNIQEWLNKVSLDTMGNGIFAHDFNCLSTPTSTTSSSAPIAKVFENFGKDSISHFDRVIMIAAQVFPILWHLPTKGKRKRGSFTKEGGRIAKALIEKADSVMITRAGDQKRKETKGTYRRARMKRKWDETKSERKAAVPLLPDMGVGAQVTTLLVAGYETTSVTMTWLMIELARHPGVQDCLRKELKVKYPTKDPTWDELWHETPYLDAVLMEVLRLHPLVHEIPRMAAEDDIIPLSKPLKTSQGTLVDVLTIPKGSYVTVPIGALNRLPELWGPDAGQFNPDRWLNGGIGDNLRAKELQGFKHILTFSDGPRICLGRHFARAQMKALVVTVVKNFTLEFEDPTKTELEVHMGLTPRPKMKGSKEANVPLRIRKVE
ncbi:cytochrome P450 [Flagelloscypha sp. PMI_526]|nr:cytochrome P450 [Flagelloscypha sp. PMI_526]